MLDIVEDLFCRLYQNQSDHTFGLGIFNNLVTINVPLAPYDPVEFVNLVETLRMTKTSSMPLCCSCCTPLAEAFDLAGAEFKKHGAASNNPNGLQILYMLSDGKPYQNTYGPYNYPKIDEATYMFETVPMRARALKKQGVKILIVAVPSRDDNPSGSQPNVDYFDGIPDPTLVPDGDSRIINECSNPNALTCQCAYQQQRAPNRIYCYDMLSPPFPIESDGLVFSGVWENIVNLTSANAGCGTNVQSDTHPPTTRPSPKPSVYPTVVPTPGPTRPHPIELDMFIILDNSLSMTWHADICRKAPGADLSLPDNQVCWELMLGFGRSLITHTLGFGTLTWLDQSATPQLGLRVTVYAFSCTNDQQTPVTITIGVDISNQADFDAAMLDAQKYIPTGGTCPGQTIDAVVNDIQTDPLGQSRPTKAAILLTDGIFYDGKRSGLAARGLGHFCVQRMALGLPGGEKGLTQAQTARQVAQLTAFAGNASNVFNFGVQGYNLLDNIASDMMNAIAATPDSQCWIDLTPATWDWCGYTSSDLCTAAGKACKWSPSNQRCYPFSQCSGFAISLCRQMPACVWKARQGCKFVGGSSLVG